MTKRRIALMAGLFAMAAAGRARAGMPTTEDFDSGKVAIADVADCDLKAFLADLQDRRDYDLDCHNGNPGPDADFLNGWIDRAVTELKARGFTFDDHGRPTN